MCACVRVCECVVSLIVNCPGQWTLQKSSLLLCVLCCTSYQNQHSFQVTLSCVGMLWFQNASSQLCFRCFCLDDCSIPENGTTSSLFCPSLSYPMPLPPSLYPRLSDGISVCPSVCLSVCLCLSVSVCLSVSFSLTLSRRQKKDRPKNRHRQLGRTKPYQTRPNLTGPEVNSINTVVSDFLRPTTRRTAMLTSADPAS